MSRSATALLPAPPVSSPLFSPPGSHHPPVVARRRSSSRLHSHLSTILTARLTPLSSQLFPPGHTTSAGRRLVLIPPASSPRAPHTTSAGRRALVVIPPPATILTGLLTPILTPRNTISAGRRALVVIPPATILTGGSILTGRLTPPAPVVASSSILTRTISTRVPVVVACCPACPHLCSHPWCCLCSHPPRLSTSAGCRGVVFWFSGLVARPPSSPALSTSAGCRGVVFLFPGLHPHL